MPTNEVFFSGIRYGVKGDNPTQIIKNISWIIGRETTTPPHEIQEHMEHIFKTTITGIGDGVAVFDWTSNKIDHPYVICARLETSVLFPATDDRSIDIVLALVSPKKSGPLHLQYLARLTRMFRDTALLNALRDVTCVDGMKSVLSPENRKFIAA